MIWKCFKSFLLTAAVGIFTLPSYSMGQSMTLQRVASGLANPIFATHAPGDPTRLYIAQRSGAIRILDLTTNTIQPGNFMLVPSVDTFFEGGLLGLAFHPDFQNNGFFYVNFTTSAGGGGFRTRISRFTATNADSANSSTQQIVLEISQPFGNHNAGWIGFSPIDDCLYVTSGDGGSGNDPGNRGQDITNQLLGKMLRLDIDGDDFPGDANRNYAIPNDNPFVGVTGDDEIFLYGLRNPFRCSFDRDNGDLYIGDVGQGAREEIDVFPAGYTEKFNMGWRLREGTIATPGVGGPQPADGINPIYDYLRSGPFGGNSVTGGVVYRGPLKGLQGNYLFADFGSNNFWSFKYDGSEVDSFNGNNFTDLIRWNGIFTTDAGSLGSIVGFGEDLDGNVYIVDLGGEVFKIVDGTTIPEPEDGTIALITTAAGQLESGSAANLADSDDVGLVYRNDSVAPEDNAIEYTLFGVVPSGSPDVLLLNFESRVSTPNVIQTIELLNFTTSEFEVFDTRPAATADEAFAIEIENPANYVTGGGDIRVRVSAKVDGPVVASPWSFTVDQALPQIID